MKIFSLKLTILSFIVFVLALASMVSCNPEPRNNENLNDTTENISEEVVPEDIAATDTNKTILVYTKYDLPLPVELYKFLKDNNMQFNNTLLNSTNNVTKYNTSVSKAINFGIYASDLAYCTVFEQNQNSILYFHTTKQLADELHIDKGYNESIIERMEENMDNNDSLHNIATKAYWNACNYLEENDNVNILPFVVSGGWIESMHLAMQTVDTQNPAPEIMKEVAMQRAALENLMDYLYDVMMDSNTFEVNEDVQELGFKFADLKVVYDRLDENPADVPITKEQFQAIAETIETIRNSYI